MANEPSQIAEPSESAAKAASAVSEHSRFDSPPVDATNVAILIAQLIERFDAISRWDTEWYMEVSLKRRPYDPAQEDQIAQAYRDWLQDAERIAPVVKSLADGGETLVKTSAFQERLEDARGMNTSDEVFFAGPELLELEARAIAALHAGETEEFEEIGD